MKKQTKNIISRLISWLVAIVIFTVAFFTTDGNIETVKDYLPMSLWPGGLLWIALRMYGVSIFGY